MIAVVAALRRRGGAAARLLPLALTFAAATAGAQINPWIANSIYNPAEWDSAGPEAATPWLHPPPYDPGQGWGILPPDSALRDGPLASPDQPHQ